MDVLFSNIHFTTEHCNAQFDFFGIMQCAKIAPASIWFITIARVKIKIDKIDSQTLPTLRG